MSQIVHDTYIFPSLVAQTVKNSLALWETWVRSLERAGKIPGRREQLPTPIFLHGEPPWTEETGRLQFMVLQRAGHD